MDVYKVICTCEDHLNCLCGIATNNENSDKTYEFPFIENNPFVMEDILSDFSELREDKGKIYDQDIELAENTDDMLSDLYNLLCALRYLIIQGLLSEDLTFPYIENNLYSLEDIMLDIEENVSMKKIKARRELRLGKLQATKESMGNLIKVDFEKYSTKKHYYEYNVLEKQKIPY